MKKFLFALCFAAISNQTFACTGIVLHSRDGATITGRTIDWANAETNNIYAITPRGHEIQSMLPDGTQNGLKFTAKYGFVGLGPERPEFIVDGINEMGLNAELFYFPDYGQYLPYDEAMRDISLADLQVVSWILANFATIDEVQQNIGNVRIIGVEPGSSTTHWRISEPNGRVVVMEIIDGLPIFYEDKIGAIANSPSFAWQKTNLNNYVNLAPGTADPTKLGPDELKSFSGGTNMLGLPGDFSSASRFVRAAFLGNWTIPQSNAQSTVNQAFHILNNFDVPLGLDFAAGKEKVNMPSATQWTIATDLQNKAIYYHTMFNRTIRKIDLNNINFDSVAFQYGPLDDAKIETIIPVQINM